MIFRNFKIEINLIVLFSMALYCHGQQVVIGQILDTDSNPIPGAAIEVLDQDATGAYSDTDGQFSIVLPKGEYTLKASYVGFYPKETVIAIGTATLPKLTLVLDTAVEELQNVVLEGKTEAQQLREKAFEVDVLETKGLKNLSVDVNTVLNTVPGIVIRESGGLGSDFSFSLNGFSGNQVKFFIDGIPQDNLGTSLSFNNFPATLIERAEVYKGVVPVYLGADALGGAINLITNQRKVSFIDASFDTGSFNTQRATLSARYYGKKGFVAELTSFFNHSDNDYTINGNEFGKEGFAIRDELGNETGERQPTARRFHDAYTSGMVRIKAGITDRKYADRILIGVLKAANSNEIQHGVSPQIPFGDVERKEEATLVSIEYGKDSLFGLPVKSKIYGELAIVRSRIIDTSSQVYDWLGNSRVRLNSSLGETGGPKTQFQFDDERRVVNTSFRYQINPYHSLDFNFTKNYLKRQGSDPITAIPTGFEDPQVIDKNIAGLSYTVKAVQNRLSATFFGKSFFVGINSLLEDRFDTNSDTRFTTIDEDYEKLGFGAAVAYKISSSLQLKTSFENTFRVPEGFEFFGDGLNLLPNPTLQPEESENLNFGILWKQTSGHFTYGTDAHFFSRNITNRLFLLSRGINGIFINLTNVSTVGVDGEINLDFDKNVYLKINATYQYITNTDTNERIANEPFLFGNLEAGYTFRNLFGERDELVLGWNSSFTEAFPSQSFTAADEDKRFTVPQQLSHTLQLGYSAADGRYNLSFQVRNITDTRLFDNLNIQKPGRAFYIKLRYHLL